MFGAYRRLVTESSVTFVSQAGLETCRALGLAERLVPVTNTRRIHKQSMILNGATPRMQVDLDYHLLRAPMVVLFLFFGYHRVPKVV